MECHPWFLRKSHLDMCSVGLALMIILPRIKLRYFRSTGNNQHFLLKHMKEASTFVLSYKSSSLQGKDFHIHRQ
jgi:hypothetical protein